MSLQRVLETARKTGMPVIITDIVGRDPMVILPLEQFEAMAGVPAGKPIPQPEAQINQTLAQMSSEVTKSRLEDSAAQIQHITTENAEFPLEEGFYLEPMDDQMGQK